MCPVCEQLALLPQYLDVLLPYITKMVNASLSQGRLPVSMQLLHRF